MSMFRRECPHYVKRTFPGLGNTIITSCSDCGQTLHIADAPIRDMRPYVEAYRRLRTAWHARGWK